MRAVTKAQMEVSWGTDKKKPVSTVASGKTSWRRLHTQEESVCRIRKKRAFQAGVA